MLYLDNKFSYHGGVGIIDKYHTTIKYTSLVLTPHFPLKNPYKKTNFSKVNNPPLLSSETTEVIWFKEAHFMYLTALIHNPKFILYVLECININPREPKISYILCVVFRSFEPNE